MSHKKDASPNEVPEMIMQTVLAGFQAVTQRLEAIEASHAKERDKAREEHQQHARATYQGMTGSGKSRYVAAMVDLERKNGERGAQARVAKTLDLTPGRIAQLLSSDKNRKNGK